MTGGWNVPDAGYAALIKGSINQRRNSQAVKLAVCGAAAAAAVVVVPRSFMHFTCSPIKPHKVAGDGNEQSLSDRNTSFTSPAALLKGPICFSAFYFFLVCLFICETFKRKNVVVSLAVLFG